MDISWQLTTASSSNWMVSIAQKVALYTLIPFTFIAAVEALIKNLIGITLVNVTIALFNQCLS
jgi:hypothetical protein